MKDLLKKLFSVTNEGDYKIFFILGFKFKIKKPGYYITGNGNKIIIVKQGIENELRAKEKIEGLEIEIHGDNNTIKIEFPIKVSDSKIQILNNKNAYIEIGSTLNLSNVKIACYNAKDQVCKIGKNFYSKQVGFHLNDDSASITVGNDSLFSFGVNLWASDGHSIFDLNSKEILNKQNEPIKIGSHCWIGANVSFSKNGQIQDNTIVGMGAVVTKAFDKENILIIGSPAKILKENVDWDFKNTYQYENS